MARARCSNNSMVAPLALGVTLAALLLLLPAPTAAKDTCNKDWMRYMVMSACGMDKRHLERNKFVASHWQLEEIINEVMEEADKLFGGPPREEEVPEEVQQPQADTGTGWSRPGAATPAGGLWKRLTEHPVEVLRLAEEWMGLRGRGSSSDGSKAPRRRAIQNMITRCCSEECSSEDFEGIC